MTIQNLFTKDMRRIETLGVAHVGPDPERYAHQLALDTHLLLTEIRAYMASLEEQIRSPHLMRLTRDRLKRSLIDYQAYYQFLSNTLRPLGFESVARIDYGRLMDARAPASRVNSYFSHLAKDWSWGLRETESAMQLVREVCPNVGPLETVLTLGAGACRLPYEIHRWLKPEKSICVDVSPLLLCLARDIIRGSTVEVMDFPEVPKNIQSQAALTKLSAPQPLRDEFEFVIHDIGEWGFNAASVDMVVTPWFIDVAPQSTSQLFKQINSVLKPGGYWLNIGPLVFQKFNAYENYSVEEVLHLAGKSGFEILAHKYIPLAHLDNPLSARIRVDHVLAFCGRSEGVDSAVSF